MKIIMTKGLPASGKTTWAKQYLKDNPKTKRVNKDELRAMLDDEIWSQENEDFVLKIRNLIIKQAIMEGYDILVDDTNLAPKHEKVLRFIAKDRGADFEVKDFTDVEPITCIERDMEREHPVGEEVIWRMFGTFMKAKNEK